MSPEYQESAKIALREKKKFKTRQTLQQQGLRLIQEQGYSQTTIEQIAEASEISPRTFYRYFATKEALVLDDDYDPILIDSIQKQPPELSLIQAFRAAVRERFSAMTDEEKKAFTDRMKLILSVPELRAAAFMQMNDNIQTIAGLVAARLERPQDDFEVLLFAGSLLGAMMAVLQHCNEHPDADIHALIDEALELFEAGFPIGNLGNKGK